MLSARLLIFSFGAPPGVPEDRVAALRKAFSAMMKDPGFLEKLKAFKLNPETSLAGEELQRIVVEALNVSPELVERARKLVSVKQ